MIPANLTVSPAAPAALIHPNGHASDWRARPLLGESRMTSSTRLRPGCVAMEIDVRLLAETSERQQRATCTRRGLTCAESACRGMRPASSRGRDLGCRSCSAAVLGPLRSKNAFRILRCCAPANQPHSPRLRRRSCLFTHAPFRQSQAKGKAYVPDVSSQSNSIGWSAGGVPWVNSLTRLSRVAMARIHLVENMFSERGNVEANVPRL